MALEMKQSTRFGLVGIAALALLSGIHWLRGLSGVWGQTASYFLGVMPNVAAAIAIPFVFMGIVADQKKDQSLSNLRRWFYVSAVLSCCGLLGWEFIQRTSDRLIFDMNDLGATVVGSLLAYAIFLAVTPTAPPSNDS